MSKLINTLKSIGESNLLDILDQDLIELIDLLGLTNYENESLASLILKIEGENCVVDNVSIRDKIFKSLPQNEAENLTSLLGLADGANPWHELLNAKYRKGSRRYNALQEWFELKDYPKNEVTQPKREKTTNISPNYGLFPHQITAVNKAAKLLNEKSRLLLHMPTGAGKTRTAMNLICDFFRKSKRKRELVVWLAHSEELCEQAAEEFEKAWSNLGNRSINVVRHFRPHTNETITASDDAFIVMSLQSAHSMAFSQSRDREFFELAKSVGLTVIDEAHKATAETYQHVLELLAPVDAANLLGLTATPGRSWLDVEEDTKLATFFLRNKLSLEIEGYENPIDYLREEGYLAHQQTVKIEYNGSNMVSHKDLRFGDFTKEQLELIGKDQARNIRIIDAIEKEAEQNAQIIVFACSVKHARLLTAILLLKNYTVSCVTGDTRAELREKSISDFKDGRIQIIINFGVLTTGFDAPNASVAVIARPTQSLVLYSQMVGRVIRGKRAGGTSSCRVVTVVDQQYGFNDLSESFDFWDDIWE